MCYLETFDKVTKKSHPSSQQLQNYATEQHLCQMASGDKICGGSSETWNQQLAIQNNLRLRIPSVQAGSWIQKSQLKSIKSILKAHVHIPKYLNHVRYTCDTCV